RVLGQAAQPLRHGLLNGPLTSRPSNLFFASLSKDGASSRILENGVCAAGEIACRSTPVRRAPRAQRRSTDPHRLPRVEVLHNSESLPVQCGPSASPALSGSPWFRRP